MKIITIKKRQTFIRISLLEAIVLRLFWNRKPRHRLMIIIWPYGVEVQAGPLAISLTDV